MRAPARQRSSSAVQTVTCAPRHTYAQYDEGDEGDGDGMDTEGGAQTGGTQTGGGDGRNPG
jgi:hypothetical protein